MQALFQNGWAIGTAAVTALTVFGLAAFFVSRYKRCPANKILVISGKVGTGTSAKCISGGGAFVMPIVQEYDFLDLSPMSLDIALNDALSLENIRIAAPTTVTIAISNDPAIQKNAAVRLLGLNPQGIRQLSDNIIVGQMRQVIASMSIQDINRDREMFLKKIEESMEPELAKVGLTALNVNIRDIKDDSGYIEATGRKASAQAVNQANADVADQERQGAVRIAGAKQEQEIKVAEAARTKEIGIANATKEKEIGVAEALKDKAVRVAEFNKEQTITVASAEADGAKGKAEAEVIKAAAFRKAETAKAEAEGAVEVARNTAQAAAAKANGERIEQEKRAELEATAKAESAKKIVDAEAQARQTVIAAEAEAKAIFAKYKAEADGTLAKLQAQAEGEKQIALAKAAGMKALVEAAGDATAAYRLLTIDQIPVVAKAASDAVQNIKFDKVIVWGQGEGSEIPNFLTGLAKGIIPLMETLGQVSDVKIPGLKTPASSGSISAAESTSA